MSDIGVKELLSAIRLVYKGEGVLDFKAAGRNLRRIATMTADDAGSLVLKRRKM